MNYGYIRVSTNHQNTDRQRDAMEALGIEMRIYEEHQSGKDFCRTEWQKLMRKIKPGDCLYLYSIDRLGRDYIEIQEQWQILTKEKKIDIIVLDMPLLDTRDKQDLSGKFLADVTLTILGYCAELERQKILQRTRQGVESALARGVKFGRSRKVKPETYKRFLKQVEEGKMSVKEASAAMGIGLATYYRYKEEIEENET